MKTNTSDVGYVTRPAQRQGLKPRAGVAAARFSATREPLGCRASSRLEHPISVAVAILVVVSTLSATVSAASFSNVASTLGLDHVQSSSYGNQIMSGGVAAADFNGDGRTDLFFTRVDGTDMMYFNDGNTFVDVSAASGFTDVRPTNGVVSGDIDNDGDQDLYVTTSESDRYLLYVNDGQGHFQEQSASRGADVSARPGATRKGQGAAMADYDGDGYLDILTSDHSRPMSSSGARLLRNLGASHPGFFEDVTHAAGIDVYRQPMAVANVTYRFTPQFADMDQDGKIDILFASDSKTSQLFWNQGDGTFRDGTLAAGVGTDKSGMGSSIADFDRDGDLDWFVTAIFDTNNLSTNPGNRLYRNNGDRTFTDVTSDMGVRNVGWGWGTNFLDYDNDGRLDLIATNGFVGGTFSSDATTLWQATDLGRFDNVSATAGITDTEQGRGLAHLDFDQDGDLDVVIVNYGAKPILYQNNVGSTHHGLRVQPQGTASNRDGIGTLVRVTPDLSAPEATQTWEIHAGDSYLSASEQAAYFGLADRTAPVDQVELFWPTTGLHQFYPHLAVDTRLLAREELLADFNHDRIVDAADFTILAEEWGQTGPHRAADGGGPQGIGDSQVDELDYLYWRANFGQQYANKRIVDAPTPEPTSVLPFFLVWPLFARLQRPRRHWTLAPFPPRNVTLIAQEGASL